LQWYGFVNALDTNGIGERGTSSASYSAVYHAIGVRARELRSVSKSFRPLSMLCSRYRVSPASVPTTCAFIMHAGAEMEGKT
jgi:hypothetical protein